MNPFWNEPVDCWCYRGFEIAVTDEREEDTYKFHHYYRLAGVEAEWIPMDTMSPYRSRRTDVQEWVDENLLHSSQGNQ